MALFDMKRQALAVICGLVLAQSCLGGPALAQDLFAPRMIVNDRVITSYEVAQRALFLQLLRAPGDPEKEALKALVEDRLRQTEAERLEITATEEEILAGIEEFAGRANLTADAFLAELAKVDVAAETLRDFVTAGILWRKVVRARFAGLIPVSELDIDRALEAATRPRALRVLVSELVIPAPDDKVDEAVALANQLAQDITTEAGFAAAAAEYSASPSATDGGRLDWLPLSNLPPAIGATVLALGPGEVSDPLIVPGAVVLFQLRAVAEDTAAEPIAVTVEWAEFLVPDDAAAIASLRANVDGCLDLYGQANGLPEDRLTVTSQSMAEVPRDVGLELARLDPGESSIALTRAGFRRFLMLCSREVTLEEPISRDQVREQIARYLEELRSAAIIREP
ncbi:MAG: hypothetical protein B7Z31_07145 [Rhodobacterales bacterium 12-65-15]|nr:MAG: hypothetical protein B7Z31_07145 [Rhodobacterales bacterium 12-65-15]